MSDDNVSDLLKEFYATEHKLRGVMRSKMEPLVSELSTQGFVGWTLTVDGSGRVSLHYLNPHPDESTDD